MTRSLSFRCPACGHHPKRVVTSTSKKGAAPRQHKESCGCGCHAARIPSPPETPTTTQRTPNP